MMTLALLDFGSFSRRVISLLDEYTLMVEFCFCLFFFFFFSTGLHTSQALHRCVGIGSAIPPETNANDYRSFGNKLADSNSMFVEVIF